MSSPPKRFFRWFFTVTFATDRLRETHTVRPSGPPSFSTTTTPGSGSVYAKGAIPPRQEPARLPSQENL